MKHTFRLFLLIAAVASMIYTGCEPVDEEPTGDDPRDPFIGVWQFAESSSFKSTDGQSYIVTISKDPANSIQVIIENFGNPGSESISVTGIVTSNQIIVSSQNLSNGWVVAGSGEVTNVNKTTMAWTYSIIAGGDKDFYSATATKQSPGK